MRTLRQCGFEKIKLGITTIEEVLRVSDLMKFIYQAKNSPHQILEGVIEAENLSSAESALIKNGLFPISLKEKINNKINFNFFERITQREINVFTQQLSNLISGGFTFIKGAREYL